MRKFLLGSLLLVFGIGLGIGAAYGFTTLWRPAAVTAAAPVNVQAATVVPPVATPAAPVATQQTPGSTSPNQGWNSNGWRMGYYGTNPAPASGAGVDDWSLRGNASPGQQNWNMGPGMMDSWYDNNRGRDGWGMGLGMMGRGMMGNWRGNTPTGQRLTIDQALESAKKYVSSYNQDLAVTEIMEFDNNFYILVKETAAGRGAFELLVDPFGGTVIPEMGPNMMWNVKYGHMGSGQAVENILSIEQAIQKGQQYLDANLAGAQIQPDGTSFYGYYTFDFRINDQVAGMLSVNGFDGSVWLHTWHGQFVAEQEVQ